MDFTINRYAQMLAALKDAGFLFVQRLSSNSDVRQVLMRHDVDLRPDRSLQLAHVEADLGVHAIYYFRAVPESWDEVVIKEIASLGHEVGYHYESLTTCGGNIDDAYRDFCDNIHRMSDLVGSPIRTICMHGSPRSSYDSKDIWKKYDYHSLGVDFEPYMDTDFVHTFYLTDTGRRWDGYKVSVRDRIPQFQEKWQKEGLSFRATSQIIEAVNSADSMIYKCAYNLMITTHPQRWTDSFIPWTSELIIQNLKNIIKYFIAK